MDSNHRFLSQEKPVYFAEGELRGDRTGHLRNLRGTVGSNQSPSSGESTCETGFCRQSLLSGGPAKSRKEACQVPAAMILYADIADL
jgi:hypothetical protein